MTTQSDEVVALKERIATLESQAISLRDDVKKIVEIVRNDHGSPSSPEYRATERAYHAIRNFMAAVGDLLDKREHESVTVEKSFRGDERVERHESFGVIQANRVSGGARLFGSVLDQHQHYITITVSRGEARYQAFDERMCAWPDNSISGNIVELKLSAVQWAELITCMNTGLGTPCTLSHVRGRRMAPVPDTHENRTDRVLEDFRASMKDAPRASHEAAAKLREAIEETNLSQKAKSKLLTLLSPIAPAHEAGVPFVLQRFNEAAETSVQAVKAEIDASITLVAQSLGLAEMRSRAARLGDGGVGLPLATRLTLDAGADEEPQS
jgi:hypothetical protein